MNALSTLPVLNRAARRALQSAKYAAYALPAMLLTSEAFAQAAGGANTLGGRMQAASGDLTTGGGWVLEILGYLLGGGALLVGINTIWQHTKNPNGQSRLGYGFVSVLAGGAFLAASLFGSFSANTIAGSNATNNGTAKQMQFP